MNNIRKTILMMYRQEITLSYWVMAIMFIAGLVLICADPSKVEFVLIYYGMSTLIYIKYRYDRKKNRNNQLKKIDELESDI